MLQEISIFPSSVSKKHFLHVLHFEMPTPFQNGCKKLQKQQLQKNIVKLYVE